MVAERSEGGGRHVVAERSRGRGKTCGSREVQREGEDMW